MSSPQGHVPEPHRGPAEGRVEGLARVRFPAEPRVEYLEVLPHRIDGAPERRGRQLDDRLPDRGVLLPVLVSVRSRPTYFPLYRLSSMFHSMNDFMYTPD